ncbi:MAG: hypothetical protein IJP53_06720, partial [Synergistaceae bacterium]|nr:hypothetical protein [Synergistaceae bacterium]
MQVFWRFSFVWNLSSRKFIVYETEPVRYQPYTTINWENSLPTTDLLRKPIISMSDTEFAKFVRALG